MNQDFLIGVASLAIAVALLFIGLPNKQGVSPRFLRFEASMVLYPPLVMVFFATGAAELITWFLRTPH
jgi:hypothetical protein